jgi:hypothetical protein
LAEAGFDESPAIDTAGSHKTAVPTRRSRTFRINLSPEKSR